MAALEIVSNAPNPPIRIPLTGQGVDLTTSAFSITGDNGAPVTNLILYQGGRSSTTTVKNTGTGRSSPDSECDVDSGHSDTKQFQLPFCRYGAQCWFELFFRRSVEFASSRRGHRIGRSDCDGGNEPCDTDGAGCDSSIGCQFCYNAGSFRRLGHCSKRERCRRARRSRSVWCPVIKSHTPTRLLLLSAGPMRLILLRQQCELF